MSSHEHVTIQRLINFFQSNESLQKDSKTLLKESVKTFRQCASEVGLSLEQIHIIAEIVATQKYGEIESNGLVHSLLPRESITEDTILMIVSKICADTQSLKVKTLLLRWIILIFDLVAPMSRCHCIYGMLFRYIDNETLCPYICHLLYLLTRKCDVTHYRIARLLELQRKVGSQPHISGLLSLYRMYHPSLISMSGKFRRFFKSDKVWEKSIAAVQQRYGLNLMNESLFPGTLNIAQGSKQSTTLITKPSLSMVQDSSSTQRPFSSVLSGKVPIYQIQSFQELVDHIGLLEITSQAHTLLSSRVFQHVLAIFPDRTVALRLSFWLHHWLNMEVISNSGETERGKELLDATCQFTSLIQECMPVCEEFLFRYLWTWNGSDYRTYILNMVSRLRIMPFQELEQKFLVPLKKLFSLSFHVYFQCSVINCLTELLTNYLTAEIYRAELMNGEGENLERSRYLVYPESRSEVEAYSTITELVRFVDILYSSTYKTVENPLLLHYYVLQFHLKVSNIYLQHKRPLLLLPSTQVLFHSIITLSAPCVALITKILTNHIQTAIALKDKGLSFPGFTKTLELLNRCCVDVFDALWRRRAFHPFCQKDSLIFPSFDVSLINSVLANPEGLPPSRMFSIDRHPALLPYAVEFLRVSRKDFSEVDEARFVLESSFMEFFQGNGLKDVTQFIKLLEAS